MLNTSPVIIFGNPRSGTRMCANVLGAHPDVCITDEFQNVGMLNDLAEQQIASFMTKRVDPDTIPLRKELLVKNYWLMRSNLNQVEKSKSSNIIGNKTPRAEHHFNIYEDIFSVNKPIYIYCARNAYDTLRSIKNLKNIQWSKLPFEELFENYKKSFRAYFDIKNHTSGRLFVINVDLYGQKPLFEFYESIFNVLGVPCDDEFVKTVNAMGPQNTMSKVRKLINDDSPVVDLSDKEVDLIASCKEYYDLCKEFGFRG